MEEEKNKKTPQSGAAAEQAWDKVLSEAKDKLDDLKETAQMRMEIRKLESQRKKAYTRLGEVTYRRLHPTHGTVADKLDEETDKLVAGITDLTHQISSLNLKLKMKKIGVK